MTDTIGWGDTDVEPRQRTRLPRASRIVWPVVVVVIAAVALTPTLKSDFATSTMRWLQHQWAQQAAWDDARQTELSGATVLVGVADTSAFTTLVTDVDREERRHLLALARAVTHHHTWAADVTRARDAIHRSLQAEAADLAGEIRTIAAAERRAAVLFTPSPYSAATATLIEQTDATVLRSATAHHLGQVGKPHVVLSAGADIVATLHRVTDRPLPLRLVLAQAEGWVEWDLRTGNRRVVSTWGADAPAGNAIAVVGSRLLVQTDTRMELVPLDGSAARALPVNEVYTPDGRGGLWRLRGLVAQRLSADLRPIGRPRAVPAGYGVQPDLGPASTGDDLLTVTRFTRAPADPTNGFLATYLWDPETGRVLTLPGGCGAASAAGVAVVIDCTRPAAPLVFADLTTGRTHPVDLGPGHEFGAGGPVLSPDGRLVAVNVARAGDVNESAIGVVVVDLTTGRVTPVTDSPTIAPIAWSPDSSTLILAARSTNDCCTDISDNQLAFWRPGMSGLGSIRIPVSQTPPAVAVLGD